MLGQLKEDKLLRTSINFLQSHDIVNSEKACLSVLEKNEKCAIGYFLLAKIRARQGQLEQARVLLEMAYALDPYYIPYGMSLADVYLQVGNSDQATALLKMLLGLYPNNEEIADKLRGYYKNNDINEIAVKIRSEVNKLVDKCGITSKQSILFGMPFSIYEPCRMHDFYLSQALKLRGANIIPLSIVSEENGRVEAVQEGENKIFGGVWGGFTGDPERDNLIVEKHLRTILRCNRLLWETWAGIPLVSLTKYITEEDREEIRKIIRKYPIANYKDWLYNSMPVGKWAVDALVNNELVGDERLVENWEKKLYNYLYNIILLKYAFSRALDAIQPDVVISNDTYYYPYAVLEILAKERSIPCYNHWSGSRKMGWCYAKDEPAMNINLTEAWTSYIDKPLTPHESELIEDYLGKRRSGYGMVLNTANPRENVSILKEPPQINYSKPTALLTANVSWDLAALNKELLFESMIDWVRKVMDFFAANPQYQLIIKPHPAEKNENIPTTVQMIGFEVRKHMPVLPQNIILLEPDSDTSVYGLIPNVEVGLVYTSTVGLEMSCFGKPVITCAKALYRDKGFTHDPTAIGEYFEALRSMLESNEPPEIIEQRKGLAQKFFYLYYFRYYTSLNLFDYGCGERSTVFVEDARELLPGRNPVLDYVCDSILNHLPIVSESRIPPPGGFKRNQYEFTTEEIVRDGRIMLNGYSNDYQETTIGQIDELAHMCIDEFEFYVPTDSFKPGELTWLYNEIFQTYEANPHAYETDFLTIHDGDIVIDAGCCEGFFVPYALSRNARKIYAFEPHHKFVRGLSKTFTKEIEDDCVEIIPAGLSDKIADAFLDDSNDFICEARINDRYGHRIQVVTLDSFTLERNLDAVDFVKMDIEGEEMNAVRGMFGVLKRFRPKLAIAVYHGYDNAQLVKELILTARPDYKVVFGGCYMFKVPFRPYIIYAF
jgi:FkbM family methyltransferase